MSGGSRPGPRLRAALAGITGYQAGRRPEPRAGLATYKLSSNEKPFPPLRAVRDAIARAAGEVNRYPDPSATKLIDAIATVTGARPSQIAVGTGSVALCYAAAQIAADPGHEIVFAWPSFEAYPLLAQVSGARPVRVPLTGAEEHDLDAMVAALTPNTRLVFVCTPNNPTGVALSAERLSRFLDEVPSDILVVIDEAYAEFVRDPDAANGLELARERANVAVLRTFSKAYGLAGLRVGYAIAAEPIAAALRTVVLPFPVSNVAEAAAISSLEQREALAERVDQVVARREWVVTRLRGIGLDVAATEANFLWLRLGEAAAGFAEACDDAGLAVRLFADEGVRVTIGEPAANRRFVRVAERLLRR